MSLNSHILFSSGNVKPHEARLLAIVENAYEQIKTLLPVEDIDIVFYHNPEQSMPEVGGIGGFTPCANTVFIPLDVNHPKFKESLETELLYTLFHEIHHAVRFRTPIPKDTLLEAMVSEGLADHFAMEVSGRSTPPIWATALTDDQKKIFMEKAIKEWNLSPYDHRAWFYGSDPQIIPRWTAYTLGYDLVKKYFALHPTETASQLVFSKASIFV